MWIEFILQLEHRKSRGGACHCSCKSAFPIAFDGSIVHVEAGFDCSETMCNKKPAALGLYAPKFLNDK